LFKNIKFLKFQKEIKKAKIINIYRKGKVICLELENNKTILVHPKMTGHFLIGKWVRKKNNWKPLISGALNDPMNRFIHLIFWLGGGDEDKSSSSRSEPPQGGEGRKENSVLFDFARVGDEDKSSSSRSEPPKGGEGKKENSVFFDFTSPRSSRVGDEDKSSSSRSEPPQGGEARKENSVFFDFGSPRSSRVGDDLMIAFSDMRKFARIELWDRKELINAEMIRKLGPDALQLKIHQLTEILANSSKKIKQVLMEQNLIAGIGNIYADEILFQAKINPFRIAKGLSKNEIEKIYQAIKPILKKAIKLGATSVGDFRNIEGDRGQFQNELKIYRRQGQKCFVCQKIIKREKIGGRSTHFCPNCQK